MYVQVGVQHRKTFVVNEIKAFIRMMLQIRHNEFQNEVMVSESVMNIATMATQFREMADLLTAWRLSQAGLDLAATLESQMFEFNVI